MNSVAEVRWLDVGAVVERTGMSESWIYKRCRKKLFPGFKVGRRWKFKWDDIEAWVRDR